MLMLWVKAVHVAAAVVFTSGLLMLAMPVLLYRADSGPTWPQERRLAQAVLAWNRRVVGPALLLVWALGLWLAVGQSLMGATWLNAKMVLVFGLSGLHGFLSGRLRQLTTGDSRTDQRRSLPRFVAPAVVLVVVVIVVLVLAKPG